MVKRHGAGGRGPDSGMGLPAALGGHSRLWSVAPTYGMAIVNSASSFLQGLKDGTHVKRSAQCLAQRETQQCWCMIGLITL